MRNLNRITNHANWLAARQDWRELAMQATKDGYGELVEKNTPPEDATWRKIDKCIAALKSDIEKAKGER